MEKRPVFVVTVPHDLKDRLEECSDYLDKYQAEITRDALEAHLTSLGFPTRKRRKSIAVAPMEISPMQTQEVEQPAEKQHDWMVHGLRAVPCTR